MPKICFIGDASGDDAARVGPGPGWWVCGLGGWPAKPGTTPLTDPPAGEPGTTPLNPPRAGDEDPDTPGCVSPSLTAARVPPRLGVPGADAGVAYPEPAGDPNPEPCPPSDPNPKPWKTTEPCLECAPPAGPPGAFDPPCCDPPPAPNTPEKAFLSFEPTDAPLLSFVDRSELASPRLPPGIEAPAALNRPVSADSCRPTVSGESTPEMTSMSLR